MNFTKHKACAEARATIENDGFAGGNPLLDRHLESCRACAEYADLRQWSARTLHAAELHVQPPLMSAVWASIHRASEQAWDYSLSRSFRNLLPYMVAVLAIVALLGGLTSGGGNAVQAASSALSSLNQVEPSPVASVLSTSNLPTQDPAALLGIARRR